MICQMQLLNPIMQSVLDILFIKDDENILSRFGIFTLNSLQPRHKKVPRYEVKSSPRIRFRCNVEIHNLGGKSWIFVTIDFGTERVQ